jgi:fructokinase
MTNPLCIFGEVLFDIFPDGEKVPGGAPFNVAWHLQAFGQAPYFISAVGNDAEGIRIRKAMLDWGMNMLGLTVVDDLPTGRVQVTLHGAEPEYDIVHPVAYDRISLNSHDHQACSMLYAGSLALRDEVSRESFKKLLAAQPENVFIDVNLRSPWWDKQRLQWLVSQADWLKLNSAELAELLSDKKISGVDALVSLQKIYELKGIILTHGSEGAELYCDEGHFSIEPSTGINAVDAVGAGDAFASVVLTGLLNNWPMQKTLERAQQFASAIVGQRGATLDDRLFYQSFISEWQTG